MKATVVAVLIILISTSVFGQTSKPTQEGPVYDRGQMIAYVYADGTRESYGYDSQWRLTRFTDRAGGVTTFVYGENGSLTTIMPDGSTH